MSPWIPKAMYDAGARPSPSPGLMLPSPKDKRTVKPHGDKWHLTIPMRTVYAIYEFDTLREANRWAFQAGHPPRRYVYGAPARLAPAQFA